MSRPASPDPVVVELRARLASIDRALVLTLRSREQTQQELFAYKRSAAIAISDVEQERVVRRRAREWAEEYGADPDLTEAVIRAAIGAGKRRFRQRTAASPSSESPVVVFVPFPEPEVTTISRPAKLAPTMTPPPAP